MGRGCERGFQIANDRHSRPAPPPDSPPRPGCVHRDGHRDAAVPRSGRGYPEPRKPRVHRRLGCSWRPCGQCHPVHHPTRRLRCAPNRHPALLARHCDTAAMDRPPCGVRSGVPARFLQEAPMSTATTVMVDQPTLRVLSVAGAQSRLDVDDLRTGADWWVQITRALDDLADAVPGSDFAPSLTPGSPAPGRCKVPPCGVDGPPHWTPTRGSSPPPQGAGLQQVPESHPARRHQVTEPAQEVDDVYQRPHLGQACLLQRRVGHDVLVGRPLGLPEAHVLAHGRAHDHVTDEHRRGLDRGGRACCWGARSHLGGLGVRGGGTRCSGWC